MKKPVIADGGVLKRVKPLIKHYAEDSVLIALAGRGSVGDYGGGNGSVVDGVAKVERQREFVTESLWEELCLGEIEGIVIPGDDAVKGLLLWKRLDWDTEILGRKCAKIALMAGKGFSRLLSFWKERARDVGIDYSTVRILNRKNYNRYNSYTMKEQNNVISEVGSRSKGDDEGSSSAADNADMRNVNLRRSLESAGFTRLEGLLFFRRRSSTPSPPGSVEEATSADMKEIVDIAGVSYSYDRFHREPVFSDKLANDIHRKWAGSSFSGRADVTLAVRGKGGRIAGFCTCILPRVVGFPGWVDMLAVHPDERGMGLGTSLVQGAISYFHRSGIADVALSTQETNLPAIELYHQLGFGIYNSAETFRLLFEEP
jgi:ribosomal protein S18 acetylase RimI-like enzyme